MSTFIFLGPSLNIKDAKNIFPTAYYLPPIACGDIIQVMKLGAKKIVIIDGYFENQPAVWHKEILYAISNGIHVYGASSIGALRAAELNTLGMIGVGKIYDKYKSGEIVDDDEVALLHLPASESFQPCSLPMINIRFTIEYALQLKLITTDFAKEFLNIAKSIFYKERTENILKDKSAHLINIQSFFAWFNDNYIDQKKLDAKEVLFAINRNTNSLLYINANNFSETALFRNLKIENLAMPFRTFDDWLPTTDKICILAKLFNEYLITKQVAKAIGVAHNSSFIAINNEQITFTQPFLDSDSNNYVKNFIKLLISSHPSLVEKHSIEILAKIVVYLYTCLFKTFDNVDENIILEVAQQFYLKKRIDSKEKFRSWLCQNNMDIIAFKKAILLLHFFDYFILKNNLSTLAKTYDTSLCDYFLIATSLNGLDKKIIKTINQQKDKLIIRCHQDLDAKGDQYAIAYDFTDAYTMKIFLDKLINSNIAWLNGFLPVSWKLQ